VHDPFVVRGVDDLADVVEERHEPLRRHPAVLL
jgi:hypothetical protein